MATKLDWNSVPKSGFKSSNGSGKPINRIKFTDNCSFIVRPIGKPVGFYNFFHKGLSRSFRCNLENSELANKIYELLSVEPSQKFAINVIDRNDNEIKVMEAPITVYEQMVDVSQTKKTKPGSNSGGDWKISTKKEGKGVRRYTANYLGPEPFSQEELKRINNEDPEKNEWYQLESLYREDDLEAVKELLEKSNVTTDEAPPVKGAWKKAPSGEEEFSVPAGKSSDDDLADADDLDF